MPAHFKQMIKVKCIGSMMSLGYFAGEEYEISKDFYEANKNCFIPLKAGAEDNKVMTTEEVKTKSKK